MRFRLFGAVLLIGILMQSEAFGQSTGNFCVRDFQAGAVCTANDVRIEDLTPITVVEDCETGTVGETIVQFEALVSAAGSPDRFDVGLFLALDGGSARDGDMCFHDFLAPPLTATPTLGDKNMDGVQDVDGGPWLDNDGDNCGDIGTNTQVFKDLQPLTFACSDSNLDGSVDVAVCTSWDNNAGTVCNSEADAFPGTNSKCSCGSVELGIAPVYLNVSKTADQPTVISGGTATFTITAASTGVEDLQTVVLNDPQCDSISAVMGDDGDNVLETTETWSWTCTVNNVTADLTNTATVTATAVTSGSAVSESASDSVTVVNPAVSLVKSGTFNDESGDGIAQAGETISYSFDVSNAGDTNLVNIAVSDPMVAPITCPSGNPIPTLAMGASETCTGSYTLTQADVDAGQKDNTATASGEDPGGNPVTDMGTESTALPAAPGLSLVKSGTFNDESGDGVAQAGETIGYSFDVANTGNQTLANIAVTDPMVAPITCPGGNPIPTLAVAAGETCTGTYILTQADVDAGQKDNTATAAGEDPGANPVSAMDTESVALPAAPGLDLVKSGSFNDESGDGLAQVGETISYSFQVSNAGNQTLTNVNVTDPMISPVTCPSGNPIPTLAVGATQICSGTYAIVQADLDAARKDNTATADSDQTGPVSDSTTVPLPGAAGLRLTKTGTFNDESGDGFAQLGETIGYDFEVTNSGGQTLTNISVSDPLVPSIICPGGNPIPSLAVGASVTCVGAYTLTQADLDAGQRDNTATADSDQAGPVTDSETVPLPASVRLTFAKSGAFNDESGDGFAQAGETIGYAFQVSNTGNQTLTSVSVTDPMVAPITCPSGNPIPSLATGVTETCTGTYTVTQADIDAGQKDNTATADSDQTAPVTDSATVPLPGSVDLALLKSGTFNDESGDAFAQPGETIGYRFEITNAGTQTLTSVDISDPLLASIDCPSGNPIPTLAVGATEICTGSYAITQADIDAGQRDNTATATGQDPGGNPVSDSDTASVPLSGVAASPDVDLTKAGSQTGDPNGNGFLDPGDEITYTVVFVNNGPVDALNVQITDTPDPNTELVTGSITTSQGAVVSGNGVGDAAVAVNVGTVASGATVTVTFRVVVDDPLPPGVTMIVNQAIATGDNFPDVESDDPSTPPEGDPTVDAVAGSAIAVPSLSAWAVAALALLVLLTAWRLRPEGRDAGRSE